MRSRGKATLNSPIEVWLERLHARHHADRLGKLASHIHELTKADAEHFGVVPTAADGEAYAVNDADALFTIQSISKPIVHGLALEHHGTGGVLRRVGLEPTGEAFNAIGMDEANSRPFNPMVNAGAIDAAREYCENRLVQQADPEALRSDMRLSLSRMDILRSLPADDIARLEPSIDVMSYEAGAVIIREGDSAHRLYLLAAGKATAAWPSPTGAGSLSPILFALGRLLTDRLRRVTAEVRALT